MEGGSFFIPCGRACSERAGCILSGRACRARTMRWSPSTRPPTACPSISCTASSGSRAGAMPRLSHRGNYGLMQIRLGTARGVGYSGDAKGLLDPDTNLTYAVRVSRRRLSRGGMRRRPHRVVLPARLLRRGRRECGAPLPAQRRAVAVDVIKPKVVRTETIAAPKSGLPPARPVGNFEPARVAPLPVQPVDGVQSAAGETSNNAQGGYAAADRGGTGCEGRTSVRAVASGPAGAGCSGRACDRSRYRRSGPTVDPPPKPIVQPIHRPERARARAGKKAMVAVRSEPELKSKTESKSKPDDPAGVVSFLKKLVTPDKKSQQPVGRGASRPAVASAAAAVIL